MIKYGSMWDWINPKTEMLARGWYLPFHDRMKLENRFWWNDGLRLWREKNPPSASYVRHMKDAGRGRLL